MSDFDVFAEGKYQKYSSFTKITAFDFLIQFSYSFRDRLIWLKALHRAQLTEQNIL